MRENHLDVDLALDQLGGSLKLYRIIIEGFEEKYGKVADEIQALSSAGRLEDAERLSHSIKGLCGNLGAKKLQECARSLEFLYKGRTLTDEKVLMEAFREEMAFVVEEVRQYLAEINSASSEAAAMKEYNYLETFKTVQKLMETLETHQYGLINTAYQSFKAISFPEKDQTTVLAVKKAVESYDYVKAKEILKTFLYSW